MRASASLFGLLVASSALAQEGLEYGFGTGRLGNVSASTLSVFNQCSGVRALAGVSVDLDSAVGFAAGDLVLFHHTQGVADAGVVDFGQSTVGRYFFRRLVAVSGDRVTLDRPAELLTEGVVQAVRVIEARQLFVRYTRSIVSPSWNGRCGGIIAALVSERFETDGALSVEGRGFRGGDQAAQPAGQVGCEGDVARSIGAGFAPTGEGLAVGSWGAVGGARPAANGGGGGVCQASGGGGGANVGRGAQGGTSADGARHVGGLGGASTVFDPTRRAFFGGGGGGGAREGLTTRGGNGGGFIWVRARTLEAAINATFSVEGSNGEDGSGGAGGGAGGTLVLQALEVVANEAGLRAGGGAGGWVRLSNGFAGPGGGGGGGLIAAWTPRTWPSDATGGAGGVFRRLFPDGGEESQQGRNAGGGGLGRSDFTLQPFAVPDAGVDGGSLALLAPRDAEVLRARRPRVAGVGEPGTPVSLSLDGQPLATLAPGLDGAFEATPAVDLADGPHEVVAQQGARTVQRRFITDVGAPAAPLISSPRARAIFSESPGVVRGAVEAGARVRVFFDDAPEAGDVLADADGGFTFLVASALPDGDHTVSAVAEDAAGNVSERSEAVPFKVSSRLERPMDAMVRSGCEAAPAVSLLLGLLAWVARRRRRGA